MQIYVYVSFEKSSYFSLKSWVLWQQTTAIYFQHFSEKDDKMLNRWELFLNTPGLISHATSVNLKYERKTYVYRSTKVVKYTWNCIACYGSCYAYTHTLSLVLSGD